MTAGAVRVARPRVPAPLRRPAFRLLWVGWSTSYAGDALQLVAQTWLIAVLTGSALAVAGSPALSTLPMLLLPLGGVVADAVDRRRLLLLGQVVGGAAAAVVAGLVAADRIVVWQIYAWILLSSLVRVASRPAYKVELSEAVPAGEARSALALASMTETASTAVVAAAGGVVLAVLGVSVAFALNAATYAFGAWTLWRLRRHRAPTAGRAPASLGRVGADVVAGFRYLRANDALLTPLVLTLVLVFATSPMVSLLAAIVHAHHGSVALLGLASAAFAVGTFAGAAYAGSRPLRAQPAKAYARLGGVAAAAIAAFALLPLGPASLLPLATYGAVFGGQTVWNASRVPELAAPELQGRLQAITTMVLALGFGFGALWAGPALDAFGTRGLLGGAALLAVVSVAAPFSGRLPPRRARPPAP